MRFSGKMWPRYVRAGGGAFTDRYQALGMDYPNPDTMCQGQCEGTGVVPINRGILGPEDNTPFSPDEVGVAYSQEDMDTYGPLWVAMEADDPADDGWHFCVCPDCGGSGQRAVEISPAMEAIMEAMGEASMAWNPRPSTEVFDSREAERIARDLGRKLGVEAAGAGDPTAEYLDLFRRMEAGHLAWQVFDAKVEAMASAGNDSLSKAIRRCRHREDVVTLFRELVRNPGKGKLLDMQATRILAYGDKHEWGALMADLPMDVADKIKAWTRSRVPEASLYNSEDPKEYGYEHTIHTTAAYGIDPKTDCGTLEALLRDRRPPEIKLGQVSKFRPDDKPYEVLKIEVGGKDMPALNKAISDDIGVPGNTFKDYQPHVTIAYVRPGECEDLIGEEPFPDSMTLTAFSYTAPETEGGKDKKTEWELGGEVRASSNQFLLAHIERCKGTGLGIWAGRDRFYKAPWVGPPCLTSPDVAELLWGLHDLLKVDAEYRQKPRLDVTYLDPEELATIHDHIGMLEAEMHRRFPTGDHAFSAGGRIYAGKKTIVWDFDGTISEDVGFPAFGAPRQDIIDLMRLADDAGIENVIQSCRWSVHELSTPESAAQQMVEAIAWLETNDVPYDRLEADKQLGIAYVDDHGFNVTDLEAIRHMIAENASGFPVDGKLVMTASNFDEMRDRAIAIAENDPAWKTLLTDPTRAQAYGRLQQGLKNARTEQELRQAWESSVDLPWSVVEGDTGGQGSQEDTVVQANMGGRRRDHE